MNMYPEELQQKATVLELPETSKKRKNNAYQHLENYFENEVFGKPSEEWMTKEVLEYIDDANDAEARAICAYTKHSLDIEESMNAEINMDQILEIINPDTN